MEYFVKPSTYAKRKSPKTREERKTLTDIQQKKFSKSKDSNRGKGTCSITDEYEDIDKVKIKSSRYSTDQRLTFISVSFLFFFALTKLTQCDIGQRGTACYPKSLTLYPIFAYSTFQLVTLLLFLMSCVSKLYVMSSIVCSIKGICVFLVQLEI